MKKSFLAIATAIVICGALKVARVGATPRDPQQAARIRGSATLDYVQAGDFAIIHIPSGGVRVQRGQDRVCFRYGAPMSCDTVPEPGKYFGEPLDNEYCWLRIGATDIDRIAEVTKEIRLPRGFAMVFYHERNGYETPPKPRELPPPSVSIGRFYSNAGTDLKSITQIGCASKYGPERALAKPTIAILREHFGDYVTIKAGPEKILDAREKVLELRDE